MKISVQRSGKCVTVGVGAQSTRLVAVLTGSVLALVSACTSPATMMPATAGTGAAPTSGVGASGVGAGVGASGVGASGVVASGVVATSTAGMSAAGAGVTPTAGGTAGAAAGSAAPSGPATFTAVLAIFADPKNNCGLCHGNPTLGGGLVFKPSDKQAAFQALVGQASKGMQGSSCGGKTYVVPMQPDASLLYDKISKMTPTCGLRMPASGVVMTDPEIATVRAWIAAGALND